MKRCLPWMMPAITLLVLLSMVWAAPRCVRTVPVGFGEFSTDIGDGFRIENISAGGETYVRCTATGASYPKPIEDGCRIRSVLVTESEALIEWSVATSDRSRFVLVTRDIAGAEALSQEQADKWASETRLSARLAYSGW